MKNSNFLTVKNAKNDSVLSSVFLLMHDTKKQKLTFNKKTNQLTIHLDEIFIEKYKSLLIHDENMKYVNTIVFTISKNFNKSLNVYYTTVKLSSVLKNDYCIPFFEFNRLNNDSYMQNYLTYFETKNTDYKIARRNAK